MLARADVVMHVPLIDATRFMMGDAQFQATKPNAIFLNIALRAGHLAAAGFDVLPDEPPVPLPPLLEAWRNDEPWLA